MNTNKTRRVGVTTARKIPLGDDRNFKDQTKPAGTDNRRRLSNSKPSGPRRIADPRDVKEQSKTRRASVQHAARPNGAVNNQQGQPRVRRQSAPARTAPLRIEDIYSSEMKLTDEERLMLANFRLQKQLELDNQQATNNRKLSHNDLVRSTDSLNRNRRVSFLPPADEGVLSTLREEEEN